MIQGCVKTSEQNQTIIPNGLRTSNMWDRMRGLLGRRQLDADQGLWISPCPSVHTIGMRYPIDVVFMDRQGKVKKITHNLKPMKLSSCAGAFAVLELNEGMANQLQITTGMELQWETHKASSNI